MDRTTIVPATPVLLDWPRSEGFLEHAGVQLWWVTALLEADARRLSAFAMLTAIGTDLLMVTTVLSDRDTGTELGARREFVPFADVALGEGQVAVEAAGVRFSGSRAAGYRLTADVGFDLTLRPTRPVVFSCGSGEFAWNDATTTTQYALGGLATNGEVRIDGTSTPATGTAWHDRQWWSGADVGTPRFGWFGLWLDNGDTLSVWDRTPTGPDGRAWATVARPDGTQIVTPVPPFALTAPETLTTHLGNTVPRTWSLDVPGIGLTVRVEQETVQDDPTQDFYTGALDVRGTIDGRPLTGRGVCDLVGLRGSWDRDR